MEMTRSAALREKPRSSCACLRRMSAWRTLLLVVHQSHMGMLKVACAADPRCLVPSESDSKLIGIDAVEIIEAERGEICRAGDLNPECSLTDALLRSSKFRAFFHGPGFKIAIGAARD